MLELDPTSTAVITMECQRGVIGDLATFPALRRAVTDSTMIESTASVLRAARAAGATVIHALAVFREDRAGSTTNAPLLRFAASIPGQLIEGSEAADVVADFEVAPSDLVSSRRHGVSPFSGTDLDALLRSRSISTIVATGVSLNVGVLGLTIEAVNLGYEVVLPTDATVAVPPTYAESVLTNTFAQLATLTTASDVSAALSAAR